MIEPTKEMLAAARKVAPKGVSNVVLRLIVREALAAAPPIPSGVWALVESWAFTTAQDYPADTLTLEQCRRQLEAALAQGAVDGWAEVWCPVFEGKADHSAACMGMVHGISWTDLDVAYDDICADIENAQDVFEPDIVGVTYRLTDLHHEPGQMSFPETGQWDFPPFWEMKMEIVSTEREPNAARSGEGGE